MVIYYLILKPDKGKKNKPGKKINRIILFNKIFYCVIKIFKKLKLYFDKIIFVSKYI